MIRTKTDLSTLQTLQNSWLQPLQPLTQGIPHLPPTLLIHRDGEILPYCPAAHILPMRLSPSRGSLHDKPGSLLGGTCRNSLERLHEDLQRASEVPSEPGLAEARVKRVDDDGVGVRSVGRVDEGAEADEGVDLHELGEVVSVTNATSA